MKKQTKTKQQIIIKQRSNDYIAYFRNNPKVWECGKSANEALACLVITCASKLNLEIKHS